MIHFFHLVNDRAYVGEYPHKVSVHRKRMMFRSLLSSVGLVSSRDTRNPCKSEKYVLTELVSVDISLFGFAIVSSRFVRACRNSLLNKRNQALYYHKSKHLHFGLSNGIR